ncbi:MAG: Toxin ParE1 [Chroococcidiopsis cubana SAG 39.79]|uniref:Toxin n=2 Tax=Chroococcidiopsis TaxID=54298 RepID=K9TU37_CHRTP|nr:MULTISPECIES: type II toxin-antitoxin system RelE/ParE family toxin [Chroococcidiopsis]AFY85908.1 plasmid stabilization system [Chroococcidiopsis thermalis PCC 7203]MDZ4873111.1 Toxin ParE1 [Chroococcidiopsis cubana SAG 39.79]PSB64006.1 type II toxin-antitoxin system RelE/ParE family toxin [Chroococcidiopsis cubana CCALA 043]RUT04526.1 plasmid stabilization protein [Chroococcidiopsis cubana SAG 39.79]URD50769.1 type II toxin-antitoxin system RelE/ParE family toxin [Chroococcidiopsis sp. CCN
MNRFRLSQQAEQDLEDIWVYLARQNELLADKQIAQILDRFPMLSQFPDMGKQRNNLLPGLRSFPVQPYIVFYTKIADGIEIVRVLHQFRDIDSQLS